MIFGDIFTDLDRYVTDDPVAFAEAVWPKEPPILMPSRERGIKMAILKKNPCESCIHFKVCAYKDAFISIIEQVNNTNVYKSEEDPVYEPLKDIPWIITTVNCAYLETGRKSERTLHEDVMGV